MSKSLLRVFFAFTAAGNTLPTLEKENTPTILSALKNIIKEYSPGDVVKILLIRDSHIMSLDYQLGSIDFTDYETFYDDKIEDQFEDKPQTPPVPEEEEEKPKVTPLPEEEQPQPIPLVPHAEEDESDGSNR